MVNDLIPTERSLIIQNTIDSSFDFIIIKPRGHHGTRNERMEYNKYVYLYTQQNVMMNDHEINLTMILDFFETNKEKIPTRYQPIKTTKTLKFPLQREINRLKRSVEILRSTFDSDLEKLRQKQDEINQEYEKSHQEWILLEAGPKQDLLKHKATRRHKRRRFDIDSKIVSLRNHLIWDEAELFEVENRKRIDIISFKTQVISFLQQRQIGEDQIREKMIKFFIEYTKQKGNVDYDGFIEGWIKKYWVGYEEQKGEMK